MLDAQTAEMGEVTDLSCWVSQDGCSAEFFWLSWITFEERELESNLFNLVHNVELVDEHDIFEDDADIEELLVVF